MLNGATPQVLKGPEINFETVASGDPSEIITAELVESVYGLKCEVIEDPQTGTPLVVPAARSARRAWL